MRHEVSQSASARLLMTTDAVGGVWTYSRDMAVALAREGIDVILAVIGPPPSSRTRAACAADGLELVDIEGPLDWTARCDAELEPVRQRILEAAEQTGSDLIQVHAPAFVPDPSALPVIAVAHSCIATWWARVRGGALPPDLEWHARATARGLERAAAVVAPSHAFAADLRACYTLGRDIHVIHNGRPTPAVIQAGDTAAATVFATGRVWDDAKNLVLLDRVAARLGAKIEIAGATRAPDGNERLLHHAVSLGQLDDHQIRARLAEKPVFVSPAIYEPFGLGVLEAAQAGCALVLADQPTFRELWHGCALFADPTDDREFEAKIAPLLNDPAARARLGRCARERSRNYSIDRAAHALARLASSLALTGADCPA